MLNRASPLTLNRQLNGKPQLLFLAALCLLLVSCSSSGGNIVNVILAIFVALCAVVVTVAYVLAPAQEKATGHGCLRPMNQAAQRMIDKLNKGEEK